MTLNQNIPFTHHTVSISCKLRSWCQHFSFWFSAIFYKLDVKIQFSKKMQADISELDILSKGRHRSSQNYQWLTNPSKWFQMWKMLKRSILRYPYWCRINLWLKSFVFRWRLMKDVGYQLKGIPSTEESQKFFGESMCFLVR